MISNYEAQIFLKEIGRLIDDYYRCKELRVKNEIGLEIQLLTQLISSELISN
ncbi:hypothetical protein [Peribacillus sp. SCS-155]|uniref:hypothetical protein n=1 Tax=Peribacillus sedimenti TaxID=3115297 RepID=UPI0039059DA4